MASEVIKLNLIPTGEMPVFHASQFDTGRLITCELYRGEDAYDVPAGYTVELHCRKVDNNIVTLEASQISDNVVKFTSTEQLTACNGKNLCEVALLDEGYRIGTLNFWLEVEVDPLKGGINSTSEIHNLENQIEEITTEIIGEDYYNKSEVDDLLADKADASTVYTKTETDTKLALKANAADVYTKSQTDTLLSAKADSSDVYTKDETDILLDAKVGKFQLDSGIPLGDVFAAQVEQAFDSDIGFYDKVSNRTLDVYTKAQIDSALALKANAADVYTKQEVDNKFLAIMPVDTASGATAEFNTQIAAPLVSVIADITSLGGGGTPVSPVPITGYTQATITANGNDITIAFGQEVYGGVLDVTRGKLHVTHGGVDLSDTSKFNFTYDNISKRWQSPFSDIKVFAQRSADVLAEQWQADTTAAAGSEGKFFTVGGALYFYTADNVNKPEGNLVYPLKTPFDIDLTPEVISAVVGENSVSSDTGNIEVKYKTTIQDYIDNHTGG